MAPAPVNLGVGRHNKGIRMREKLFQNTREVVYQVVIFATLVVYFSALFKMKLPSNVEHFAVIASTVFAILVFAAMLAAHDYFSRLNIRLFHIAKSIEQSILQETPQMGSDSI